MTNNFKTSHQGRGRFLAVILMLLALLVPGMAFASGGEDVTLQFSNADAIYLYISLAFGAIALVAGFAYRGKVLSASTGDEKMQEVGKAIRDGALAYLRQQRTTIGIFVVLLSVGLYALYVGKFGPMIAIQLVVSFILGVTASYVAGYLGMDMAVNANMRTAAAALTSYKKSLEVSFQAGAVAGLITVGMGLIGATLIFLVAKENAMKLLVGFGFGGSLAALFMRVGGGIYTKAADVGADLVGKVEAGIPEDDPRNPAVIADNVGDNVGDCAGMAADVFESYEVTLVAAIVLGAATAVIFPQDVWMKLIIFALMARGVGIIASIIGIGMVKGSDDLNSDPLARISKGFQGSAAVATVLTIGLAYFLMGGMPSQNPVITASSLKSVEVYQRAEQQMVHKVANAIAAKAAVAKKGVNDIIVDLGAKRADKDTKMITADEVMKDSRIAGIMSGLGFKTLAASEVKNAETEEQKKNFFTPEEFKNAVVVPMIGQEATADKKFTADLSTLSPDLVMEDAGIQKAAEGSGLPVDQYKVAAVQQALGMTDEQLNAPVKKMEGFAKLSWTDSRIANYTVQVPASEMGQPPVYKGLAEAFKDQPLDKQYVVYKLGIEQTPPSSGPERPKPMKTTVLYGPVIKEAADKQIADALKNPQGGLKVDKLAIFPTELLMDKKGRLAVGVISKSISDSKAGVKELGVNLDNAQRMTGFGGLTYFREKKDVVEKAMAGNPTAGPKAENAEFGVSATTVADWWRFFLCIFFGIAMAFAFERMTDYYVSAHKRPVQEVAGVASAGPAPMIIQGFALGLESSVFSVLAICISLVMPLMVFPPELFGGYVLSFYGIALVGLGLLTTTGYILAMDTFGPISDNAQGVFEMSGAGHTNPEGALAVQRLDAAGNTTKALTKGFAIATAVVAAVALFHSYIEAAKLTTAGMPLEAPEVFVGLLVGGAAPFLFAAFLINAVGRASFNLIGEVRRQFREDPGIMAGTSKPDYARCVAIVTAAAQKELLGPGILAIALPMLVVMLLAVGKPTTMVDGNEYNLVGAQALGGFLAGTILTGQLLAVLLANSGGIWDNAKKVIEDGMHGGKGTDAHKAGVVCDTVGDPFKDTAGPALNPLIKVMNLVALLAAPYVIFPGNDNVRLIGAGVCLAALVYAIYVSKKGSIATEMQSMTEEGK